MKTLNGNRLFWMTFTFVICNFTIGPLVFHHTFIYALDNSIEDIFMALMAWYVIAEKV